MVNKAGMIKEKISLQEIKAWVNGLREKRVDVTVNLGRNKYARYTGTLKGVYPALFTVKPDGEEYKGKTTYSYAEYLCGKVKLKERA